MYCSEVSGLPALALISNPSCYLCGMRLHCPTGIRSDSPEKDIVCTGKHTMLQVLDIPFGHNNISETGVGGGIHVMGTDTNTHSMTPQMLDFIRGNNPNGHFLFRFKNMTSMFLK